MYKKYTTRTDFYNIKYTLRETNFVKNKRNAWEGDVQNTYICHL